MKKIIFAFMFLIISHISTAAQSSHFEKILGTGSLAEKQQVISQLIQQNNNQIQAMLLALNSGNLYWSKKEGTLVIKKEDQFIQWPDQKLIIGSKNQFKRITINNAIRQLLDQYQLQIQLSNPSNPTRRAAAKALFGQITTSAFASFVAERLSKESDHEVKQHLLQALAFTKLDDSDENTVLVTLSQLESVTNPLFVQKLNQIVKSTSYPLVKEKAQQIMDSIEKKRAFYEVVEQIYFGLSLGSILVLAAIGLAITFGVMGVINMAHGELIMIGAYTTYVMQQLLPSDPGLALLLSIPLAFIVSGCVGILIERCVIRFLYGRALETLLATFGISLLLQQLARTIFSPLNKAIIAPDWMQGSIQINDFLSLTVNRLYILIFSFMVFLFLLFIMKRTSLGLNVRAISMNRMMAQSLGVRASWVNALTFGLGAGIAGLAGVALSQVTNVGPNLGQNYIIDSFMVVVFGGVGSLWGTLIAGLILGLANKFIEPVAGAMLAKIMILVGLVLFIQKRPRGLFPQRGRAVEG